MDEGPADDGRWTGYEGSEISLRGMVGCDIVGLDIQLEASLMIDEICESFSVNHSRV